MRRLALFVFAGGLACGDPVTEAVSQAGIVPASPETAEPLPAWGLLGVPPGKELPARVELQRQSTAAELIEALESDDPDVLARGAWTLGRIGGIGATERFVGLVSNARLGSVGLAAAGFLEPLRADALERALWTRYAITESATEADALLFAIGRVGSDRSQSLLAIELAQELDGEAGGWSRFGPGMHSVGLLCARGVATTAAGLESIAAGLQSSRSAARRAAAYALGRCAGPSAELLAGTQRGDLVGWLTPLTLAEDPSESRLAWIALAALAEVPQSIPDEILGPKGPGWVVEVEAVRALASHADGRAVLVDRLAQAQPEWFSGPRIHVVLESLRRLRGAAGGTPEILVSLKSFAQLVQAAAATATGRERKRLHLIVCQWALLASIVDGDLQRVVDCAPSIEGIAPYHGRTLEVEALVRIGSVLPRAKRLDRLFERVSDAVPAVAALALSALADVDDPRVGPVLRDAVLHSDPGIAAAAAGAIAARSIDGARRDAEAVLVLSQAVSHHLNQNALEARLRAIEALGNLAKSAPRGRVSGQAPAPAWLTKVVTPLATDPNAAVRLMARGALSEYPELVAAFDAAVPTSFADGFEPRVVAAASSEASKALGLKIETDAGEFVVDFSGAPAPIAQANLVALARAGFFDGLTIHRVVPGFVIQGGDPHGDGYSGPGYVMPCERSSLKYVSGTVGIALAGKDTGGSQFFVTQAPAPHLDGRYTVIGRVSSGMDAVETTLPYDRIKAVTVVDG